MAGTIGDRPVVAVRVRASVGRPGRSAHVQWRRLRTAEWSAWTRTRPWRVAVTLGIGAAGGLFGSLLAPRLGLLVAALAVMATAWGLRFRPSPDAVAWRRVTAGERRTAQLLDPLEQHGWAVLHDLAVPGSQANIDAGLKGWLHHLRVDGSLGGGGGGCGPGGCLQRSRTRCGRGGDKVNRCG